MHIFGITFVLYILKISAPKGIWFNLRTADPAAHKVAITYQRHQRKVMKAEMDLKFLLQCRDSRVFPTIVKWKILKRMKPKDRTRHHERNLSQSIEDMNSKLRNLRKDNDTMELNLRNSLRWMKCQVFKYSIKRLIDNDREKVKKRHEKKLDKLIVEKALKDGVHKNPNPLITNLTEETLSKDEIEVLTFGLNHGVALRPREDEILPLIEGFYSKVKSLNVIKNTYTLFFI